MISLSLLSIAGIAVMVMHSPQWTATARWTAVIATIIALFSIRFDSMITVPTIEITRSGNLWAGLILGLLALILLVIPNRNATHPLRNDHIALLLFATVGAVLLTRFDHVVTLILGLEMVSIPLYVLAAQTHSPRSHEASLKYFILGAFSSAILTFGIALWYRSTGVLTIPGPIATDLIGRSGIVLMLAAMCFKVGLVPFHYWVPDVYEGTPTSFTAYMASVAKVAAFAALFKVATLLPIAEWNSLAIGLGGASILLGSFAAIRQKSVKRMLAYSSIAQAGFWILLLNGNQFSVYFGFAYATASILLLWIVDLVESSTRSHTLTGLMQKNQILGVIAIMALVSLAGIPPFAGFYAKYSSLFVMMDRSNFWIVGIGLLGSAMGAYYYLKNIAHIVAPPETDYKIEVPVTSVIASGLAVGAMIILGLAPLF